MQLTSEAQMAALFVCQNANHIKCALMHECEAMLAKHHLKVTAI